MDVERDRTFTPKTREKGRTNQRAVEYEEESTSEL